MVNRRVLIILEEGAQARLLICDHAMDNVNFLATQVIEVFAEENSVFDLYELEETHTSTVRFSNLYVKQGANSNVLLNVIRQKLLLPVKVPRSIFVVWPLLIKTNTWTIIPR